MIDVSSIITTGNINQPSRIRTGNIVSLGVLTATDVGYSHSEECLTKILRSFNLRDIVITLARINLFLQRSDNSSQCESILKKIFCSDDLRNRISQHDLANSHIFTRAATLLLLSKSVAVANAVSTNNPDTWVDVKNKIARCYLVANALLRTRSPESEKDLTDEQRKQLLVDMIPSYEYATHRPPSSRSGNFLVKSEKFFRYFEEAALSSKIDVNEKFTEATGMALRDYQCLIWGILKDFLALSQQEILTGNGLFIELKPSTVLMPLYDKLLQHTCIHIDKLAGAIETTCSLPNEFRLWRQYPLIEISENRILCVDIGFLEDKLESGVFWIIGKQLNKEKKNKGRTIFELRGRGFENYVASIIQRGINAQCFSEKETYVTSPKYDRREEHECTDIAVFSGETLVLFECKAPLLSAKSKFCGDFSEFHRVVKSRIIAPDGRNQLWNAIQALGHTNKKKRRKIQGICMSSVKKIFPVLVVSDPIFSFPFINWYLNSEFQPFLRNNDLKKHLQIMPLTVLTIDDLERLESYLRDTPFHEHLNRWVTQVFRLYPALPFSVYFRSLVVKEVRENTYIEREVKRIHAEAETYFSLRGVF